LSEIIYEELYKIYTYSVVIEKKLNIFIDEVLYIYIYIDNSFSNEQVIKLSNFTKYNPIIGDLYYIQTSKYSGLEYVIDVGTKGTIRRFNFYELDCSCHFLTAGTITSGMISKEDENELKNKSYIQQEFSAL
jgi:hypothetical protein